jgi:pescadillo protein
VDEDATKRRRLFSGLTFFLSREVPRGYLELVCLAFGAKVGWEGDNSLIEMSDSSITHHVVDRPKLPSSYDKLPKSREFIQPQWILDSANFMFCLPIAKYGVGVELPPHLSPWVDDEEEGYTPAYATEIQKLRNGEAIDGDDEEMEVDEEDGERDDVLSPAHEDASDAEEEEEDEEEDESKAKNTGEKEDADAHDRAKVMMSRKASRLYGRMQNGISLKEEQIKKLQKRREDMKGKFKDADGKTVTMQKVVRLKKERKTVGDEYAKASSAGSMKKIKKQKTSK